ncbi:MAG: FAD-binding protein, partial [Chloroflexi bacterium]|nr:FAD-binding protein [Chloroflexota bacterium]
MSVVRPADAQACAAALLAAARDRRSVRVRGGGTKSYLGDARPADVTLETGALAGAI